MKPIAVFTLTALLIPATSSAKCKARENSRVERDETHPTYFLDWPCSVTSEYIESEIDRRIQADTDRLAGDLLFSLLIEKQVRSEAEAPCSPVSVTT